MKKHLRIFWIHRRNVFGEDRGFIYCLSVWGDVVLSGGGDGMLLAHDRKSAVPGGGLLWGLGASSQGAVRAIGVSKGKLIAAGDDGNVLSYAMPTS